MAQTFVAALVDVIGQYPDEVVEQTCGPKGIPSRLGTARDLSKVTAVCDDLYEPIKRRLERERIAAQPKLLARPPRTPQEQAEIDAQVAAWRRPKVAAGEDTGYPFTSNGNGWAGRNGG